MISKLKIILNLSHVACIVRINKICGSEYANNVSLNMTYHTGINFTKKIITYNKNVMFLTHRKLHVPINCF